MAGFSGAVSVGASATNGTSASNSVAARKTDLNLFLELIPFLLPVE